MVCMTDIPSSFFETHRNGYVGTALARGPWDPGAAHGGPVAALIGREIERFDPDPNLQTVRFTIELLKPVPLSFLEAEVTMLRPGKRVRLVGVSLRHDGVEVARATALRILNTPSDAPASEPEAGVPFAAPEGQPAADAFVVRDVGILSAVEIRSVVGSPIKVGPSTFWFRVHKSLVDDEPISPLTRTLIPADFGNGISSVLSIEQHLFINPDLTVNLHRLPAGEWVANDAHTWLVPGGAAVAEARLFDRTGQLGRATQNLFIAAR